MRIVSQPRQLRHFTRTVPASELSTSGGCRRHMSRVGNGPANLAAGRDGSDTNLSEPPSPSTTAILTGSTQQISRFGAGRSDRSRVGNVANNGGVARVLSTFGLAGDFPTDALPVRPVAERDRTHVPVPRGVQVDTVLAETSAPDIRLGHGGSLWLPVWLPATLGWELHPLRPAPRPRLERGTYCLGGTFEVWLGDAGCRLTCCSAATIMAGYGLTRPCGCGRWLPVRLPGFWLATLTFEGLYLLTAIG